MDRYGDRSNFNGRQYPMQPREEMPEYPVTGRDVPLSPADFGWGARGYPEAVRDVPLRHPGPEQELSDYGGTGHGVPLYTTRSGREERDLYSSGPIPAQPYWDDSALDPTMNHQDLEDELAHLLSTQPGTPPDAASMDRQPPRIDRRRARPKPQFLSIYQKITQVTALFAAIAVCAACLLVWSIAYTYGQLSETAESVLPTNLARWWPLTLYGPWSVAALSILRAAVQRQPAKRSWGVLLVTSAMAVALCVSHSSHSALALVTLGIPPITSLVCFWELVGQFSSKQRIGRRGRLQHPSKA
ncbi:MULTISPECIES: DUF2637 domain-containing protein [unclassified Streptomyces]|uniref:DUF2637 domain-containing protein n=1 Tax=unclassified Streptomyces TaxID=2593676 RepID=UPI0036F6CE5D